MDGLLGASAPGKLMIAGEYAVLTGAPAVVAAVDARASACWSGPPEDGSEHEGTLSRESQRIPPEAVLARSHAEEAVRAKVPHALGIDVSALRRSGQKLGLGSSAAAAAAAAGAVFAWAGEDVTQLATRRRILRAAIEGHHAVAPEGSGADVAAAVLGGFVHFRRGEGTDVSAEPLAWPEGLSTSVVWTCQEARTSELVAKVRALETSDPARFGQAMDRLSKAAEAFVERLEAADREGVVDAAGQYGDAMGALGEAAGAPIVEARLSRVAELARSAGGAAKPSGAGGGDVAIAFFADSDARGKFEAACRDDGLTLLPLQLGADGVMPCCA